MYVDNGKYREKSIKAKFKFKNRSFGRFICNFSESLGKYHYLRYPAQIKKVAEDKYAATKGISIKDQKIAREIECVLKDDFYSKINGYYGNGKYSVQFSAYDITISCNKFIICEELGINIRRYSCFLISNLVKDEYYEHWEKLGKNLKEKIQINSLSLLGDKVEEIRISASILVSAVKHISNKNKEWPNLIITLCNACDSDKIEFKISAIKTLGIIWENSTKNDFTDNIIFFMV